MDNKITSSRLKTFIAYDLGKLLAFVLGVILVLYLVFNAIAKKPTDGQDYYLMIGDEVIVSTDGKKLLNDVKDAAYDNYGFSYDVLRVNNMQIDPTGYSSTYLMDTYVQLSEDDVFIVNDDGSDDGLYKRYISQECAIEIFDYINAALTYVKSNNFVDENGVFNEEKIRLNFNATRGEDSRFKTEKAYNEGVENEIKRIKAIYNNANTLKAVLQNHPELLYKQEKIYYNGQFIKEGYFALNLSVLQGISNLFTRVVLVDEESGTIDYTTDGIVLMIGNNYNANGDLNYESLALVNSIINKCSTFISELN